MYSAQYSGIQKRLHQYLAVQLNLLEAVIVQILPYLLSFSPGLKKYMGRVAKGSLFFVLPKQVETGLVYS